MHLIIDSSFYSIHELLILENFRESKKLLKIADTVLKNNNLNICLDLCHLGMSVNSNSGSFISWYDELIPFSRHLHLADYKGEDGEGLQIGEGEITNFEKIFQNENVKVLEIWQGHLNSGYAFKEALFRLYEMGQLKK